MKQPTPPANIIIGILYFAALAATFYVIKLVFKNVPPPPKDPKYTPSNFKKGLSSPIIHSEIKPLPIIFKSYLLKYTFIGGFFNSQKIYLLKEILIFSMILVACISINTITLWPIGVAIFAVLLVIIGMQIFGIPLSFRNTIKIEESEKKIEVESGEIIEQPQPVKKQIDSNLSFSLKFLLIVGAVSLGTVIMISNAMFAVFYSVSNLGALNIGSTIIVILIDQCGFRVVLGASVMLTAKIMVSLTNNQVNNEANVKNENYAIFQNRFFENLCLQTLVERINQIYVEKGEPSDIDMGASPLKKKSYSPSKVPKAQPLYFQVDTLMNLQSTKRQEDEKVEQCRTPIKQIALSQEGNNSIILTSFQRNMFNIEKENSNENYDLCKPDVNRFFSDKRPEREDTEKNEQIGDDGLILVETDLHNIGLGRKANCSTLDVNFSPSKRKRSKMGGVKHKKRQLIITGSSPYLQYLPDMMKKKEMGRKSTMPVHSQQNATISNISRRVL